MPIDVPAPGGVLNDGHESDAIMGKFLRDVMKPEPGRPSNFRLFGPDETASNRLTGRPQTSTDQAAGMAEVCRDRRPPQPVEGRLMEVLSEHQCRRAGSKAYLLTGRHGLFNSCYEAFVHIIDSMFNQHAKWLEGHPGESPGGGRSRR